MKASQKPILRALAGETLTRPPFWLMRQAGRYLPEYRQLRAEAGGFLDLCYAPALAAEVTLQPLRRFGMDAAILFSDILLVPQALGQKLWFESGEGPKLAAIRTAADLTILDSEGVTTRLAPVYEAIRRVITALPHEAALIGFAGAPWTVATYMVEGGSSRAFAATLGWARNEPETFQHLIDRLVEATIAHLSAEIAAGVEVLQLFDTWASAVPAESFERWVIAPTRRIVDALKERHPDVPVIGFPRGIGALYPRYFRETGVRAVSIDASLAPTRAAETLQTIGPVQGNLDPKLLVAGGAALDEAVHQILDALGQGPFIFNLGHGVLPETPVAHVERLVQLIRGA
jgi:uroporphyrinogen decarboxylase